MRRPWLLIAVFLPLGGAAGCGPVIQLDDEPDAASSTGTPSTTSVTQTTTTTTTATTSTTTPGTTVPPPDTEDGGTTYDPWDTRGFLDGVEDGWVFFECDLYAQDCPIDEKCMPWANDGGDVWNATRCSPIDPSPSAVGDPCQVEGSPLSGLDDCELGSMCWNVSLETLAGTCTAMCSGSERNPTCEDPSTMCATEGETGLALCLPVCDPLEQDCAEGLGCYPVESTFLCVPDGSGDTGAPGDPCQGLNACDPGRWCAAPASVPMCMDGVGCCSGLCDVTDPLPPCLPGQECLAWYAEGTAPMGYENVGACIVPPP